MYVYTLDCELITHQPLESVFKVFEDPYNLAKITPANLSFRVISKEHVTMRTGAEIEYNIKWLGVPLYWKTLVVEYQPPLLFIDKQLKGPYRLWVHHHTFETVSEVSEAVRVHDHVEYALPFGLLGSAVHAAIVRRQLLHIFNYRQERLAEILKHETITTRRPEIRRK
jgi:hypothetical protein